MRKLLNTLYVIQEEAYLSLDGEEIVVLRDGKVILRHPLCNLESVVCFSYPGCSPALMAKCCEHNVALNFLNPYGKFLAHVSGEIKGNVFLRRAQYRMFDDPEKCLETAKITISAKLANCRLIMMRGFRDHGRSECAETAEILKKNMESLAEVSDIDSLRGKEGESARMYFMAFDKLISIGEFSFSGRTKRPPLDEVNALLSFMYTMLRIEVVSALETVGLDPYSGFMHTLRAGRPSLALDMVEELRGIVERFVLNIVNMKILSKDDFLKKEGGSIMMADDVKRKLLAAWREKLKQTFHHDVLKEKISYGLLPYAQAQLLAGYIRGDFETYMPFLIDG